jgi:very-short-patch-repair endonuclease
MPKAEAVLWNALRQAKPLGFHFRRQVPIGPYYADFVCHHPKLVIEVDGLTHTGPNHDAERDEFLRAEGYRVLRVWNDDVLTNVSGVMDAVLAAVGYSASDQ